MVLKFKNITVKDFFERKDITFYEFIFKEIKKKNEFKGKATDLKKLSFDDLNVVRILIQDFNVKNLIDIYSICYSEYLLNGTVTDFFRSYKYLVAELKEISELEKKLITNTVNPKLIKAGIDKLNKFKSLNTKIALAEQFGKFPQEIGKMKYIDVLMIQAYNSQLNEIKQNLTK